MPGLAAARRSPFEAFGRLGSAAGGLLAGAAGVILIAALLAAPAIVYVGVAAAAIASSITAPNAVVDVAGSAMKAGEAASYLRAYAPSAGAAGVLIAYTGVAAVVVYWACRSRDRCRGSIARAAAGFWGLIVVVVYAVMARGGPLLQAPGYVVPLGVLGGLLAVAAAAAGGRAPRVAAALGVAAAVLLAVAVYQGGFPFKAGSVDVAWLERATAGNAEATHAAAALAAYTQPRVIVWEKAAEVNATLAKTEAALQAYKSSGGQAERSLDLNLRNLADVLEAAASYFPEDLASKARGLAERARALADQPGESPSEVESLLAEVRGLVEEAAGLPPARLNAAAYLEALALLYPGTLIAAVVGSAGGLARSRRARAAAVAAAVVVAGLALAFVSIRVYSVQAVVNDYISGLVTSLDERSSNSMWRAVATGAGLVRVSSLAGALAGVLAAAGGALAAVVAVRELE